MSGLSSFLRRLTMTALHRLKSFLHKHPKLQRNISVIIQRLGLYQHVRAIYARITPASSQADKSNPNGFIPTDIAQLSPHARQIYAGLKAAIERHHKENC